MDDAGGEVAACRLVGRDVEQVRPDEHAHVAVHRAQVGGHIDLDAADKRAAALDAAVEQVHIAEEVIDKRRGRRVIDLVGRADLLHAPVVHDHDAIGQLQRLLLVVGDKQAGDVQLVVKPQQPAAQVLAHLRVERAKRLVEQQHLRAHGQRPGQRDALPLSAGQLRGIARRQAVELHELQQVAHLLANGGFRRARRPGLHAKAEGDVLEDRQVPEERVVLEDEADATALRGLARGVDAVEVHATLLGRLQAADDAQQRRLARSGRPQQRDQLAGLHGEIDAIERRVRAEAVRDALHLDAHASTPAASISATDEARHSTIDRTTSVTSASVVSSDATANAALKLYSL